MPLLMRSEVVAKFVARFVEMGAVNEELACMAGADHVTYGGVDGERC